MADRNRYRSSQKEVSWRDRDHRDGYSELWQEQFSGGWARNESASAGRGQKGGSFVGLDYGRLEMGLSGRPTRRGIEVGVTIRAEVRPTIRGPITASLKMLAII